MTIGEPLSHPENCSGPIKSRDDGATLVVYCDACGWSVATTSPTSPLHDETRYAIRIAAGLPRDLLVQASVELGIGIVALMRRIKDRLPILSDLDAYACRDHIRRLRRIGIEPQVEPPFPWSDER